VIKLAYHEFKQRGTGDFPIELYYVDKNHSSYFMPHHFHSDMEIIRVIDGNLTVTLNDKKYNISKGDIIFVNPGTIHSAVPYDCVYECIVFNSWIISFPYNNCEFFIDGLVNHLFEINPCFTGDDDELHKAFEDLFCKMKENSTASCFGVIASLCKIMYIVIRNNYYTEVLSNPNIRQNKKISNLKKIIDLISQSYSSKLTIEYMAAYIGMSKQYFCTFFKAMTDKTPIEYLTNYRIEKASHMLLNTNESITDIAFDCGFNDLSYFIKTFCRIKGISPLKFRKKQNDVRH